MQSRSGTVTPPPSPTSGQNLARTALDVEGLATGTSEVCTATLEVLAHLFSWIDLSISISTNLLDAIFSCAKYYDAMVGFYFNEIKACISRMKNIKYIYISVEWQTNRNGCSSFDND